MLFMQSHAAKIKFEEYESSYKEDSSLSNYTTAKKCKNKQRKAIHAKISQLLGLQLIHRSTKLDSTCHKRGDDKITQERYQLLSEKKNDDETCEKNLRKTFPQPILAIPNISLPPQQPSPCRSDHELSSLASSSSLTSSSLLSVPASRVRKLTPPPPQAQLFSGFPSTGSNRKGKNVESGRRQRKKSICEVDQPQIQPQVPKETCVNVMIGRIVCRKYIPRLQRVEEVEEHCFS